MADIRLIDLSKTFANGVTAVHGISIDIADGEFLVLVGPSGCGKSTLLRMVAGLEEVSAGQLLIGGRDVTYEPPKARDVAMVFQSYALYPHMTVRKNIAYPLKLANVPPAEIARRVDQAARLLQLEAVLDRRPSQLSGGQRQRVAMGRAIVRKPTVFLMDEPLSNLDAKLRVQMRAEIARLQRNLGVTTIYVTHDQIEAMTMGQRVAVMRAGSIEQCDTPKRLYEEPANLFIAAFIGSPSMNLYCGRVEAAEGGLEVVVGPYRLPLAAGCTVDIDQTRAWAGRDIVVGLRPEAFGDPADHRYGPRAEVDVLVDFVEALGVELIIYGTLQAPAFAVEELVPSEEPRVVSNCVARLAPETAVRSGENILLTVDTSQIHLFDPVSHRSLRYLDAP